MAVIVIISLFLQDVSLLAFDPDADPYVTGIYIGICIHFVFEFLVLCRYQDGYLYGAGDELGTKNKCHFSLFFWTDLVAILSVIPDLVPIDTLDDGIPEGSTNTLELLVAGFRVLRLFRLWRIFRVLKLMDIYTNKTHSYAHRIGKQLSSFISMKVGACIILITGSFLVITYDTPYVGPYLVMEILENLTMYSEAFNNTVEIFNNSYPIILIKMDNKTVFFSGDSLTEPRGIEIEEFSTLRSKCYMDVNEVIKGQAALNIVLIIAVMIFFVIITVIVTRDVKKKAIKPMKAVTDRLLEVGAEMGVYRHTQVEEIYKNPDRFYNELLDKMKNKVAKKD